MNTAGQIEALLLASDEPISLQKLRDILSDELDSSDIRSALSELESHYQQRGIQIIQVGGGWQFRTAPEHAELVHQLWEIRPQRLSRSALETLAIIAYRQPTTRAEIEALRGFKVSSSIIATLQERGWIKVLGRKEVPGRPHLFGTGKAFLKDFGLNSLQDLPDSAQLMDEDEIQNLVGDNVMQIQQGVLYETEQASEASENTDEENPQQGEVDPEAEETSP
jgi:segregation and condensation protein B